MTLYNEKRIEGSSGMVDEEKDVMVVFVSIRDVKVWVPVPVGIKVEQT